MSHPTPHPSSVTRPLQLGAVLGRYELLAPIAEGGMASVWAARLRGSRGFSKTFAIKTMLPALSDDPRFETMFLDEARIASRIRHPNVVEILDLGEHDGVLYLVMEWVDGEPIGNLRRDAVRHGGMPLSVAVRIIADACAGLHAAHELKDPNTGNPVGLVHRDISPQNILVTFNGVVKIVDFGVAKAAGRSSEKTSAGQVKGKPPYMSPEQALGDEVDRRADIFALGIILYQLTTGKHPFRGESDLVTLHNIVSDSEIISPRAHEPLIPKALDAVILKALSRDLRARFQTMAEFEGALDAVVSDLPRARQQDVADFVEQMAGSRGEERRSRISQASRAAEERSGESPSWSGETSVAESNPAAAGQPIAPARSAATPQPRTEATHGGQSLAAVSPDPGRSSTRLLTVSAAAALLGVAGGLWFALSSSRSEHSVSWDAASLSQSLRDPAQEPGDTTTGRPNQGVAPNVEIALVDPAPSAIEDEAPPSPSASGALPQSPRLKPRTSLRSVQPVSDGDPSPQGTSPRPTPKTPPAPSTKRQFVPPPVNDPGF